MTLAMKYGVDSRGEFVKRKPIQMTEFERRGKLYKIYADAKLPPEIPVDFALINNSNTYNDWILFPLKRPISSTDEVVRKKLSGDYGDDDKYIQDIVQDTETGQWYYLGCYVCVCERNYCDGNYILAGRDFSDFYSLSSIIEYLDCKEEIRFESLGRRDYNDRETFLRYAPVYEPVKGLPRGFHDIYLTFMNSIGDLPQYSCFSNEMSLWLLYRYGTPVTQNRLFDFYNKLLEWGKDNGLDFTASYDKTDGSISITVTSKFDGKPRTGTFYYREEDDGLRREPVLLFPSGIVRNAAVQPKKFWDDLQFAIEQERMYDFPVWFETKEAADAYMEHAKSMYKQPAPLKLRRKPTVIRDAVTEQKQDEAERS